ncbi:hypothetical protein [Hazenella coriacea]|uniref:Tfp pilus assembly protein PilN n=1 Tax=Hazenella coriacea TaxID=1179467 RepID=A0A4V2UVN8_9BACL|nr:hypothetical protein [Hazenella coriacea]TCS96507.1 Tfp pilus assembly protein PilN [Hazenella coriacea]
MKLNLMPRIPWAKRFFGWWLCFILMIWLGLIVAVVWFYQVQSTQLTQLDLRMKQLLPQETKAKAEMKERETFYKNHRAVLDYQQTVQALKSDSLDWSQAIAAMESATSAEGRLFNLKVQGNRLEAMAAFSTMDHAAYFQSQMKKNTFIQNFTIDKVEEATVVKEVEIKPATAKVVHFHFIYQPDLQKAPKPNIGEDPL